MEMRVLVISVVTVIIVSLSLFVQNQSLRHLQNPNTAINLLEAAPQVQHSAGPAARQLGAHSSTDPWGSYEEGEGFDRSNSRFDPSNELNSENESESFEPDAPTPNNMLLPTESSSVVPPQAAPSWTANLGSDLSISIPESAPVPHTDSQPVATIWESSVCKDFADSSRSLPPEVSAAELADVALAGADNVAPLVQAAAPPIVEPVVDLVSAPVQRAPAEPSATSPTAPIHEVPPSIVQIARNHLQYGNSLARRGSLFSARQEFFSGLRLIIESLDLVNGVRSHREHYSWAIVALNEAEDFMAPSGDDMSNSVSRIVDLHQSKILNPQEIQSLTSMAAMQAYFAFAQENFSAACDHSPTASELLFSLGKLHAVKAAQDPAGQPTDLAIAILMHQAALNVDPANYRSANELGVALAKLRYFEPARAALLQSIATQPTAEAWLNLSSVHRALGETRLADLALAENQAMEGARESDSTIAHSIRWMAPNEFATTQQARYEETESPSGSPTNIPTAERIPPSPTSESGIWASLKRSFGTH